MKSLTGAADLVIFGGPIVTMNDAQPSVEAIAVKDGIIAAVGTAAEIKAQIGPATRVVDLGGKALLPGFIDAHGHFMNAPRVVVWANVSPTPVGPVTSIPDLIKALQDNVAKQKIGKGEWIVGYGYDATQLTEQRDLTRRDIDPHFPDNPVMVIHVSNHGAVLNSLALKTFDITAQTPTPEGGLIAREPGSQEPAGLLMETAFMPIFAQIPQPSEAELLDLLAPAQHIYTSKGMTTVQEGATHADEVAFLRKAGEQGRLVVDVVSLPFVLEVPKLFANYIQRDAEGKIAAIGDVASEFGTYKNRLKLGGIKMLADGSPQGKTAFWTKPLLTDGPKGEKNYVGQPTFPKELIVKIYKQITEKGVQVFTHANGDAAIDIVIDAAEASGNKAGDDRRHVVIHSQCMRPDQLDRYVELGLSPSFFTLHTYYWGDVHLANLGPERAFFISPTKSASAKGIAFSNHHDFMVTPIDPLLMVWSAVARRSKNGTEIGPDERTDVLTALKAITIVPAWQYREEHRKGSIEVGKLADLVILERNPLVVAIDDIPKIAVVETLKEGKTIYSRAEAGAPAPRLGCEHCDGIHDDAARAESANAMAEVANSPLIA